MIFQISGYQGEEASELFLLSLSLLHTSPFYHSCVCATKQPCFGATRGQISASQKKKTIQNLPDFNQRLSASKILKKSKFVVLKHYGILLCHSKQGNSCFYYVHFHTYFDRDFPILLRNQYEVHIYIANQNTYEYKSYSCGSVAVTSSPIKKQRGEVFLEQK